MKTFKQFLFESATGREAEIQRRMKERTEDLLKNQNQKNINQERLRAEIEAEMSNTQRQSPMNAPAMAGAGQAEASARLSAANRVYSDSSLSREQRQEIIDREGQTARQLAINDFLSTKEAEEREAGQKEREKQYGPISGGSYENISELSPEEQQILNDKIKKDQEASARRHQEQARKEKEEERRLTATTPTATTDTDDSMDITDEERKELEKTRRVLEWQREREKNK